MSNRYIRQPLDEDFRPKAYLAGPDVFFPNALEIGFEKKRICAEYGFEGIFPLDNELQAENLGKSATAEAIFQANCKAMDEADFVVANMMPFRGVSTDVGTAFEVGYMFAKGKPVFGYGSDGQSYIERLLGGVTEPPRDHQGMHVEGFDLTDNLMLVCAVRRDGVDVVSSQGIWSDLSAFTECVRVAAARLPHGSKRVCNYTLPLAELPVNAQYFVRDELASRALDLIKNSPGQRMNISDLTEALAIEYSRSEREVNYVLRYMLHKRKINKRHDSLVEVSQPYEPA